MAFGAGVVVSLGHSNRRVTKQVLYPFDRDAGVKGMGGE